MADQIQEPQPLRWKIGWGVTHQCNMNCVFCYSSEVRSSQIDLDFSDLAQFIDINNESIESINYGTGENTLSEHWFKLVKYIRKTYPNITQALTTNGYLAPALHKRRDAEQILASLDEVDLSLDFHDPLQHTQFRGHPKAYDWVLDSIDCCQNAAIKTTIVVMGIDVTLEIANLERLLDLAKQKGCFLRINIFRPNHAQKISPLSYTVLKQALSSILTNHRVVSLGDPLFYALICGKAYSDATGKTSLRILPDGSITPSTYLVSPEWRCAHIKDTKLQEISFRHCLIPGLQDSKLPTFCQGCSLQAICKGGAIDRRIIWYGTLEEPDPYCPYRHGDTPDNWSLCADIRTTPGPIVHDGYLPTLIFAPGY